LYFSGYTLLIIVIMDPHCIGRRPCLSQLFVLSMGYARLSVDIIYCCWLSFCSSVPVPLSFDPRHQLVKHFGHHIVSNLML
jgi:hypothetical protein